MTKIHKHYVINAYVTSLKIELSDQCQMEFWIPLTSQNSMFVLSALKVNRPNQRNMVHIKLHVSQNLYIWTFVDHFPHLLRMVNNILYHSWMIILDMHTCLLQMKSLNSQMCSNYLRLKLGINTTKELRMTNLKVAVNTTVDMTVQVNNVGCLLPNTQRNMESSHSTPCQCHLYEWSG